MSPAPEHIKDDATVSDIVSDVEDHHEQEQPEQPPVTVTRKPFKKFYAWFAVGLVLVTLVFGLAFGLTSSKKKYRPPGNEAAGELGIVDATLNYYQLAESIPHVSAINLDQDQIVYIDSENGCLHVINYGSDELFAPLCKRFIDVRSIAVAGTSAIIAQGSQIEHWHRSESNEWLHNEGGAKRTKIIYNKASGFGKKIAYLETISQLIVASDESVFVYRQQNGNKWKLEMTFDVTGFAVDEDQTTLALYDSNTITVYDIQVNRWYAIDGTIVYDEKPFPISSVKLSDNGVHVISKDPDSDKVTVYNLETDESKYVTFESKIVGDAVYSVHTGCIVDAVTGEYLSVAVKNADDVFDIKISEGRIVVLLEREGENMMEIYEN